MCRNCPVFTDTHDSVLLSGFSLAHIEFFSYAHQHHHRHRAHSFFLIDNCKYAVIVVCALFFIILSSRCKFYSFSLKTKQLRTLLNKANWIELTWLDWASCEIHLFVFGSILNERNFASSKLWVHSEKRKLGTFHSNCRCLLCVCAVLLWNFRMFQYFPKNFGTLFYVCKFVLVIVHACVYSFKMQIVHLPWIRFEKKIFFPSPWIEHFVVLTDWFEFCI